MLIYKTETVVKTKLQLVVYFCWERQISGESGPIHFIKARLSEIFISTAHQAYTCKVELETKVHEVFTIEPETGWGFYESSSCLCLLVTALSFTTTAGSDKLKALARVGVFSTAITKFNWVNCWKHNIFQQNCVLFGLIDIFARQILRMELSPHVKYNSGCHFICYQQVCPLILLPTV